jgi:hypothetical protein
MIGNGGDLAAFCFISSTAGPAGSLGHRSRKKPRPYKEGRGFLDCEQDHGNSPEHN